MFALLSGAVNLMEHHCVCAHRCRYRISMFILLLLACVVLIFVARCVHELLLIHDLCHVLNRGGARFGFEYLIYIVNKYLNVWKDEPIFCFWIIIRVYWCTTNIVVSESADIAIKVYYGRFQLNPALTMVEVTVTHACSVKVLMLVAVWDSEWQLSYLSCFHCED